MEQLLAKSSGKYDQNVMYQYPVSASLFISLINILIVYILGASYISNVLYNLLINEILDDCVFSRSENIRREPG